MNPKDFKGYIAFENDRRERSVPDATVVIVAYNSGTAILELIDSLKEQSLSSFEIIIINNGRIDSEVVELIMAEQVLYVENRRNSVSLGRNIGTAYARGNIIIFLDDDCIAHKNLVKAHVQSYRDPSVLGVQGKGLPKRLPFYCHFQSHYDLGPTIKPAVIGQEGNSSYKKRVLNKVGGFDPELFGAEGLELSYRIFQKYKQPRGIIYSPEAIIYHDFAKGFFDYLEKCYRHPKVRKRLFREYPQILSFAKEYGPYPGPEENVSYLTEKIAVRIIGFFGRAAELIGKYS